MMDVYLVYILLFQIGGILLYTKQMILFGLFFIFVLYYLFKNGHKKLIVICVSSLSFSISVCYLQDIIDKKLAVKPSNISKGQIISSPLIDGNRFSFIYKINHQSVMAYSYADKKSELKFFQNRHVGDICLLKGEINPPEQASNPYLFDYEQYLKNKHIYWVYQVKSTSLQNCMKGRLTPIQSVWYGREFLTEYVEKHFGERTQGYINALIFGDRSKMSQETESYYQLVGIVHLLAISGSHINLISVLIYFLCIRVGMTKETSLLINILFLIIYLFLAGASASVVRAVIVGVIVCAIKLIKKNSSFFSILCITCIFMLMIQPNYLFDIGFQFSYLTSAALVLTFNNNSTGNNPLKEMLKGSIVSQMVSLPILLCNFHEFSPYSILLNLLFIPFISLVIMPLCIACFLLSFISTYLSTIVEKVLEQLIIFSEYVLKMCMKLPFIKLIFIHPPNWLVLIYILCIIYLFDAIQQKNQKQLKKASVLFCAVLFMHYFSPYFNPFGKVMFIDVGQGDSILIKLPFNRGNYLIDTGGKMTLKEEEWKKRKNSFSTGKDIVIPILKGEGISSLDKLIFTHGDFDHIGGGIDLLKSFKVKTLCVGDKLQYKPVERDMIQFAIQNGITVSKLHEGIGWANKIGEFHVLSPQSHYQGEENHGSVVVYAIIGGHSWLFTGDFEQLGEKQLIQRYPSLSIDYLKVGHHGSESSSSLEFLKKIKPKVGIISVGKKNRYGHPKPVILNRYASLDIPVLRTDQQGAIIFRFFGRHGTFYTFKTYRKT